MSDRVIKVMGKRWTVRPVPPNTEIGADQVTYKVVEGPIPIAGYWYTLKGVRGGIKRQYMQHLDEGTPATVAIKASRRARRYDKERGCYVYDISFKASPPITERVIAVAEAFGLGIDEEKTHTVYEDFTLKLMEGDVVYITGDSGGGKSLLLKAMKEDLGAEAIAMNELPEAPPSPVIDAVGSSFREALTLLSRVGLNDAQLFLKRYSELSEGQRYRFKLAQLIETGKKYWICDEFCSTLDRETARIVSYNTQKQARRTGSTLIVATAHGDLEADLNPSVAIRKGWGKETSVEYRPNLEFRSCTVTEQVTVRESNREEYKQLAYLHYREERAPVPQKYYATELNGNVVGVIVYSYPPISSRGRRTAAGYAPSIDELNRDWALISRVIIHPKYRSTGLGSRIIQETLMLQGRRHVELTAVMAQYNPFAERAGMKLILVREPHHTIPAAIETLRQIGFNPSLMSSKSHNLKVLATLDEEARTLLHQILLEVSHQYYKRLARQGAAYTKRVTFEKWLKEQGNESLAHTLKTLSILNQTKAYLYWCRDWKKEPREAGGSRFLRFIDCEDREMPDEFKDTNK